MLTWPLWGVLISEGRNSRPTVGSCGMDQMGWQPVTNGQQCWLWSLLLFSPVELSDGFWTPEFRRYTFRYTSEMLVTILLDLETGRVGSKLDHLLWKLGSPTRAGSYVEGCLLLCGARLWGHLQVRFCLGSSLAQLLPFQRSLTESQVFCLSSSRIICPENWRFDYRNTLTRYWADSNLTGFSQDPFVLN